MSQAAGGGGAPIQVPDAPALRHPLELSRSLRPLMRKVPSRQLVVLDEEATVNQIAENQIVNPRMKAWSPVQRPAPERWLDLALVVEETTARPIWQKTIQEFQQLAGRHGAFRDVRLWRLVPDTQGNLQLFAGEGKANGRVRSSKELIDAEQRRLIVLMSDCVSPAWQSGQMLDWLRPLTSQGMVTVMQLLPARYWERSALGRGYPVQVSALAPGLPNAQLEVQGLPSWARNPDRVSSQDPEAEENDSDETMTPAVSDHPSLLTFPIVTLEPALMQEWSRMLVANGGNQTLARVMDRAIFTQRERTLQDGTGAPQLSGEQRFQNFWATASPQARRLAGYLAAVPVSMPIVRLVQQVLLPESSPVQVAEVFFSGMLRRSSEAELPADEVQYEFVSAELRDRLGRTARMSDTWEVLEQVSAHIAAKLGLTTRDFPAVLRAATSGTAAQRQQLEPFARIASSALRRFGGEYVALAEAIEQADTVTLERRIAVNFPEPLLLEKQGLEQSPSLQTFEFEVATIAVTPETEPLSTIDWLLFQFESATLERQQRGILRNRTEWVIKRQQQEAYGFVEMLDSVKAVQLEMVQIPGGSFVMGAPKSEEGSSDDERPQHSVTMPSFALGKYPVTQSQWRAIAALPQVNRELEADPSDFKGDNRPIENVSWQDAVEFCGRLSRHTQKAYRLPSEAEWEYACRAGTTTPFHFGETMTPELANYNWSQTYGKIKVTKEKDFRGTTSVGQFGTANAFGLYDMHGNVWEWCADHWHSNYDGVPTDGSAWLSDDQEASRLLRGGAWGYFPVLCRSASRFSNRPGDRNFTFGFRVVCSLARTSQ